MVVGIIDYGPLVSDTACSVAAVNLTRAHPLSRAAYNVLIVYLLCEIHSGYDAPCQLCNVVPWRLMMGSREHVEHHATGRGAYAKFFSFLELGPLINITRWTRGGWAGAGTKTDGRNVVHSKTPRGEPP